MLARRSSTPAFRIAAVLLILVALACESQPEVAGSSPTPPPRPVTPTLSNVELLPTLATVHVGGRQQFAARGLYSNGTTAPLAVTWSATGGAVTSSGLFTADSLPGTFLVIATGDGRSDTSTVTIVRPPEPGPYQTIAKQDWRNYTDKTALDGMFGVEGGLNAQPPALPNTAFYELESDPLFGNVIRYNGGPHLNTTAATMPGRVATHVATLGTCAGQPNTSWWTAPNGCWYPTHIWVRQFIRFSPNWTGASNTGGQGSADYKTMFLRYFNSPARHDFIVHSIREWWMSGGNPGLTLVDEGRLPWHNVETMNVQYNVSGFSSPDLAPMVKPSAPDGNCYPSTAPCGPVGDGEWYEMVMHHKTVGNRGEFTQYLRRYTSGGTVSPGPWRISAHYSVAQTGQVFSGISHYAMGINRNRQYDEVMSHYWGPYEVVDGSQYPNPWSLPTS